MKVKTHNLKEDSKRWLTDGKEYEVKEIFWSTPTTTLVIIETDTGDDAYVMVNGSCAFCTDKDGWEVVEEDDD